MFYLIPRNGTWYVGHNLKNTHSEKQITVYVSKQNMANSAYILEVFKYAELRKSAPEWPSKVDVVDPFICQITN